MWDTRITKDIFRSSAKSRPLLFTVFGWCFSILATFLIMFVLFLLAYLLYETATKEAMRSVRVNRRTLPVTQRSVLVTTLMGGRGYIQWRGTHLDRNKTSHLAQINNSDAYLVIWDHKL